MSDSRFRYKHQEKIMRGRPQNIFNEKDHFLDDSHYNQFIMKKTPSPPRPILDYEPSRQPTRPPPFVAKPKPSNPNKQSILDGFSKLMMGLKKK